MIKYRREFRRVHRSVWGAVALFILLGFLLQNVAGSVYYSLLMEPITTVSSAPVELQNGTAGTSTIYTNGTSALVSVAPSGGGTDVEDYVDNNSWDEDGSADKGTHSNFTAQQYGPDSVNDTLTEEDASITYEYIWISGNDDYVRKLYKSNPGGTEVLSWDTGTSYPFGCEFRIESGNEYIYIVDYGAGVDSLIKFHATNGTEVARWNIVGFSGDAYGSAWNGSKWFIADRADDRIYGADWGDASADMSFYYTGISYIEGLAYDGTYLWAVDMGTDYVYKLVIPASGFDVEVTPTASWSFTPADPVGIAYDTISGHLWIVSSATELLYEYYTNGTQINSWDPSGTAPEGVAYSSLDDTSYQLDLEVQWTNVDYDEAYEFLCIYGGTMGAENIRVDVWYSSAWQNVFEGLPLSSGWNNVSITSYLDSSNFTIRFKGWTESLDDTQDTWEIDAALLHVWSGNEALGTATTVTNNTPAKSIVYSKDRVMLRTTDPNNTLHVFQKGEVTPNNPDYIKWWRSTDNGETWSFVTSTSPFSSFSVTKDNDNYIHMVYAHTGGSIYYRKFLYNASSFGSGVQIDFSYKNQPDIAIAPYNNSWVYVVYDEHAASPASNEVYLKYSTDGGATFVETPYTLTYNEYSSPTAGTFPSVVIDNTKDTYGHIYVTWFRGHQTLYIRNGTINSNGTVTWRPDPAFAITNSMSDASTTENTNMMHSAMYLNGKYRVVYCESGTAKYNDWDEILFFSGEIPLATVSHYPSMTYDWNNYTYVFYYTNASNLNYDIRYQRSVDTTPTGFGNAQNVTDNNEGNQYVNAKLGGDNNRVEFVWVYDTGSPYSVKYNYLSEGGGGEGDFDYVLKAVEKDNSDWKVRLKAYNDDNKDRLDNCTIYFYNKSQPITNMNFTSNADGWSSAHTYNGTSGGELVFTEVTWDSGNGNPSPGSAGGSAYGGASEGHATKYWGTVIYNFSYTFTAPTSGWTSVTASFAWKFNASGTYTNNVLNSVKLLLTDNSDVVLEELYVDNNGGSGWTGQASVGYYYRTSITVSASMTAGNSYKLKVQFMDTDTTGSDEPSVTFRIDDVGITFTYPNSNQIIIINGTYTQQTGPWYDLAALDTIYFGMHVETSIAGTSYIYTYLEIRVPNSTVYARYTITFKIT